MNIDYNDEATYNGHITVDANNCLCGYKYKYYGILNRKERLMYGNRVFNNYLKWMPLKDVPCDKCRELRYKELRALTNES